MLTKEKKHELVGKFGAAGGRDSGSTTAQIALLTARINDLQDHFARKPKDHLSRRGLLQMVGHRRRLLGYLRKNSPKRYITILQELSLRR